MCVGCRPTAVPSDETILTKKSDRDLPVATPDEGLFLEPRQMDLGKIELHAAPVNVTFQLHNRTGKAVSISRIETTCGCTAAKPEKHVLASGESTMIAAAVKIRELGQKASRLRVETSDSVYSATGEIRWVGGSTVDVSPQSLSFGRLTCGTAKTLALSVTTPDRTAISDWLLNAEVVPSRECTIQRIDEGDRTKILVTVTPQNSPGDSRGSVRLTCRDPIGTILVPIDWVSQDEVSLEPKGAFRSKVIGGSSWKQKFLLRSEDPGVTIVSTGRYHLNQSVIKPGLISCELHVETPRDTGPFHIEVPIDLMLSDGRRKQCVFGMSGLVAP
ncbi:MAG: DUF1573 domain-containing protein [Planctomycetota bacterium]